MVALSPSFVLLFFGAIVVCKCAQNVTKESPEESSVEKHVIALPEIEILKTLKESRTQFTGKFQKDYAAPVHEHDRPLSHEEEEAVLSWEIAWPRTGKRVQQIVSVHAGKLPNTSDGKMNRKKRNQRPRRKRNIYDTDNRYYIPSGIFSRFPFASVVKISSGCTGTLVSPRHVLTAAHCIHDQTDYIEEYKDLKVGLIQPRSRFAPHRGVFRWIKVVSSHLPQGWKIGIPDIAANFDYCLLKLESAHNRPFFKMGISENRTNGVGERIHFTAFEDDKPKNTMWYRYCLITDVDPHILYHYCDAKPGSSGSGVYLWDYDSEDKNWARKLIGVFSGTRSKEYTYPPEYAGYAKSIVNINFNAAIRINSVKYTQICKWMDSLATKTCKKKYYIK